MSALQHLADWDQLSAHEREGIARKVAETLAPRFHFQGIELCTLGDQRHWIAMYTWREIGFALLPGYHGLLGVDAEAVLALTRDGFLRCYPADAHEHTVSDWVD